MKKIILLSFLMSTLAWSKTTLLLIGGGSRPADALRNFTELAGGENSSIVVIPWSSNTTEGAENIRRELMLNSFGRIEIASTSESELRDQLNSATGIFFTGGDQLKHMKVIHELNLKPFLKNLYDHGVAFAGTSAGTAIMSERMLTGEGDLSVLDGKQIGIAEGLGLLPPNVVVDQHFIVRSRFNRLAGVVLDSQVLGIAIDEDSALLIENNTDGTVYGPTQVLFMTPEEKNKLSVTVFEKNQKIDLRTFPGFGSK